MLGSNCGENVENALWTLFGYSPAFSPSIASTLLGKFADINTGDRMTISAILYLLEVVISLPAVAVGALRRV